MGRRVIAFLLMSVLLSLSGTACSKAAKKERHLARANKYFQAGEFDKAEIEYLSVIQLSGPDPVVLQQLGRIYFDRGDLARTFAAYGELLKQNTNSVEAHLRRGSVYIAAHKYKEAREEAAFVLSREPANDDAILMIADAVATPADLEAARRNLLKLSPAASQKAAYLLAMGSLSLRQQDTKSAETFFNQALARDPKNATVHAVFGNLYWMRHDLTNAERSFKTAADLSPIKSANRLKYAQFKYRNGKIEEAKNILHEVTVKAPDYLPAMNFLAELNLGERKYEACTAILKKILTRDPSNFEALLLQGQLKSSQNEPGKAIEAFEKLVALYPQTPQAHYELALVYHRNNDRAKAQASLTQALRLEPNHIEAALLSAQIHMERGDATAAISLLQTLLKKNDRVPRVYLLLADAYNMQGATDEVVSALHQMATAFPQSPEPGFMAGLALQKAGQFTLARKEYESSIARNPHYIRALEKLVEMDIQERQYAAAMQRVQKEITDNPSLPEPQYLLAQVRIAQGASAQAEAVLSKIIEIHPDYRPAYMALSQLFMSQNQPQLAIDKLQTILNRRTNDLTILMQIALVHESMTHTNQARDIYEKILAIEPKFTPALNNLAYLYSEKFNQSEKALPLAARARELLPSDPYTADTLGWILFKKGDYAQAAPLLDESSLKLNNEPEVQYHTGMVHYMLGDETPARAAFERALKSDQSFPGRDDARRRLTLLTFDPAQNSAQAILELEKQLSNHPSDPIVLARLAGLYEGSGALDKAQAIYEKMLDTNPNAVTHLIQIGLAHEKNNTTDKAEAIYQRILRHKPTAISASLQLGRLYERCTNNAKAQSTYEDAMRDNPKDAAPMILLAQLCANRLNNPARALELAKKARALDPDNQDLAFFLGRMAYETGDPKWAFSLLSECSRQRPDNPDISYYLALSAYQIGRVTEAVSLMQTAVQSGTGFNHLEKARRFLSAMNVISHPEKSAQYAPWVQEVLKNDPDDLPALMASTVIAAFQNQPAAQSAYERILAKYPFFTPAIRELVLLYSLNPDKAQKGHELSNAAREAYPDDPELSKAIGIIAYRRGDHYTAARLLQESARKRTNDAEVFFTLGLVQKQLNLKKESADSLQKALAINPNAAFATEARRILNEAKP